MTAHHSEEQIRVAFNRHAPNYGRNFFTHWVGRSEFASLAALIPAAAQPGVTPALDYGCGAGRTSRFLLDLGYRVLGYDLSPRMVELAQRNLAGASHVTFTTDRTDLSPGWPLILALGVLDYYPDTTPLWQEWRRLLAPDGRLVVTAPNAASPLAWIYALASRFTCPAYPATLGRLQALANAAGLTVVDWRTAFPAAARWGHTLALSLRVAADGAAATIVGPRQP